jgi:DNA-binding NtrC family response regulator
MEPLRILLLEDDTDDAELIGTTIAQAGIKARIKQVQSEVTFQEALDAGRFDIILADFALPRFDGIAAIQAAARRRPEIPVVIISGVIGEDLAVEMLRVGASDYILKSRLDRLVPVIMRCLRESENTRRILTGVRTATAQMRRSIDVLRGYVARALPADAVIEIERLNDAIASVEQLVNRPVHDTAS